MAREKTMEALFGELRAMLARDDEATAPGLLRVLRVAWREDPARYADEWTPYLRAAKLPRMVCGSLDEVEERARLVPPDVAKLVLRLNVHKVGNSPNSDPRVAADERLAHVRRLEFVQIDRDDDPEVLARVLGSPHLTRLSEVSLEPVVMTFAKMPRAIVNTTLIALAKSKAIPGIERLAIHNFLGGATGWKAFLGSPASHGFEELVLRGPFHEDASLERPFELLAASPHVRLRHLGLPNTSPTAKTLASILGSPVFAGLESLDLSRASFEHGQSEPLWGAGTTMRPKRVQIGHCYRPGAMSNMLRGAWLSEVESLTFTAASTSPLDVVALEALLEMPHMQRARDLDLGAVCALTRDELELVARWPHLAGARVLRLGGRTPDPEGLRTLLRSPNLGRLELLDLEHAELTAEAARVLVDEVDPEKIRALALGHVAWSKKKGRGIVLRSGLMERVEVSGIH